MMVKEACECFSCSKGLLVGWITLLSRGCEEQSYVCKLKKSNNRKSDKKKG